MNVSFLLFGRNTQPPLLPRAGHAGQPGQPGQPGQQRTTDGDKQSASAWAREMESAQLAMWFQKPLPRPVPRDNTVNLSATALTRSHPSFVSHEKVIKGQHRESTLSSSEPNNSAAQVPGSGPGHATKLALSVARTAAVGNRSNPPQIKAADLQSQHLPGAVEKLSDLPVALARITGLNVVISLDSFCPLNARVSPENSETARAYPSSSKTSYVPTARSTQSGPSQIDTAIRLHAEWHRQDVVVWLGMDTSHADIEQHTSQLLSGLRTCLQMQGSRLVKLICNGRTIFEAASSFSDYFTYPQETL